MTTVINGSYPSVNSDSDATINGLTVGKGGGSVTNNTAVGTSALAGNSSGGFNTVVGYQSAQVSGSGYITTLGYQTCYSNTSGIENIGIGYKTLYTNATGNNNVAVGDATLFANTASNNTAIGHNALNSSTTASNNTAVGSQSGYSQTSAAAGFNSYIGYKAGYSNLTGDYNTFVGGQAGQNTTGAGNTFVGVNAGQNTTGTSNTFIGCSNGASGAGNAVTTGSNNTVIGAYSGNQGGLDIRTLNNQIVISDGAGNPRFGTTGASNLVLFGTNAYISSYNSALYAYGSLASSSGVYLSNNATSWASTSDERRKDIIEPITDAVNKIFTLRTVIGKFKVDEEGVRRPFLIAQDVQAVFPEAVNSQEDEDGEFLGMSYTDMVPLLVAAIKELKIELDATKAEVAALKAKP